MPNLISSQQNKINLIWYAARCIVISNKNFASSNISGRGLLIDWSINQRFWKDHGHVIQDSTSSSEQQLLDLHSFSWEIHLASRSLFMMKIHIKSDQWMRETVDPLSWSQLPWGDQWCGDWCDQLVSALESDAHLHPLLGRSCSEHSESCRPWPDTHARHQRSRCFIQVTIRVSQLFWVLCLRSSFVHLADQTVNQRLLYVKNSALGGCILQDSLWNLHSWEVTSIYVKWWGKISKKQCFQLDIMHSWVDMFSRRKGLIMANSVGNVVDDTPGLGSRYKCLYYA